MLEKHLHETDEQLRNLQRFRRELASTLEDWKKSGEEGVPGEVICGLIERTIRTRKRVNGLQEKKSRESA